MEIIGHRGARGLWPENTLGGFKRALGIDVKAFELDVCMTKDGVIVVTHDPWVNREITRLNGKYLDDNGPWISSLTYAELQQYDVGRIDPDTFYSCHFPDQQAIDGERIPRLIDVFNLVQDRAAITVEVKSDPEEPNDSPDPETVVAALKAVIEETPPWYDITISSFDWRIIDEVHKQISGVPTAALTDEDIEEGEIEQIKALGAGTWSPYIFDVDAVRIEQAHSLGLRVVPWTAKSRKDIETMRALGVDGIITDRPDLV